MEIWAKIKEFEFVEASNYGRVRTLDRTISLKRNPHVKKGRILTQYSWRQGYKAVIITHLGKKYVRKVHRLVYEAFNGDIPDNLVVDHINNIKDDNRIENLQLITNSQNLSKDTWRHRKSKELPVGVYRETKERKCNAVYRINNTLYYLGSYDTPEEASVAYWRARNDYEQKGILPTNLKRERNYYKDGFKVCSCCKQNKPISEYYLVNGKPFHGKCKECTKRYNKEKRNNLVRKK